MGRLVAFISLLLLTVASVAFVLLGIFVGLSNEDGSFHVASIISRGPWKRDARAMVKISRM